MKDKYMRQAIVTKYQGANDKRHSRIKACAEAGSITVNWDRGLDVEQNHANAARLLAEKFGWKGTFCGGGLPGAGFAFVLIDGIANPTPADIGPSFKR